MSRAVPVILALCAFGLACFRVYTMDGWLHLEAGEWILENRSIPTTDLYTATALGSQWRYHEWLPAVAMQLAFRAGGFELLTLLKATWVTLVALVLYAFGRGRGIPPWLLGPLLVVGFIGAHFRLNLRPHLSYFMTVALTLLLVDLARRRRTRWIWALVPIELFWANSHGSFFLGPALVGLGLGDHLARRWTSAPLSFGAPLAPVERRTPLGTWVAAGLAMTAAIVVNPYGPELLAFPFHVEGMDAARSLIGEWRKPVAEDWVGVPGALAVGLCLALAAGLRQRRLPLFDLGLMVIFGLLATRAIRFHADWCLVMAPVLAAWVTALLPRGPAPAARPWVVGLASLAMLGSTGLEVRARSPIFLPGIGLDHRLYPLDAGEFVARLETSGNIATPYLWGSYFIWRLWPDRLVLLDGRAEIQDPELLGHLVRGDSPAVWKQVLDQHGFNVLVTLRPPDHTEQVALSVERWTLVFWDDLSLVWLRTEHAADADLEAYSLRRGPESYSAGTPASPAECAQLERLVAASAKHHDAAYWLAHCRFSLGDLAGAEAAMASAMAIRPEAGDFNDLGLMRLSAGDAAGAAAPLRRALELQPVYPEAAFNLANVLWEAGDRAEAAGLYQRFLGESDATDPALVQARALAGERGAPERQ